MIRQRRVMKVGVFAGLLVTLLTMSLGAQTVSEILMACKPGTASEAPPEGVPSYWSWVSGAEVGNLQHASPYTHANYWGAVFRGLSNTTPANTEVQIVNTSMWLLYNNATEWVKVQGQTPPDLGGSTFSPQYNGGGPDPQLRHSSSGTYVVPAPGYIWHFWYGNSYQPYPNTIKGMLVNSQIRLVLKNASGTDDRAQADYLVHLGADMRDPNDPNCANNSYICPSFGVGKFFKITSAWRNVSFHSVTQANINSGMVLPPASIFALPGATGIGSLPFEPVLPGANIKNGIISVDKGNGGPVEVSCYTLTGSLVPLEQVSTGSIMQWRLQQAKSGTVVIKIKRGQTESAMKYSRILF